MLVSITTNMATRYTYRVFAGNTQPRYAQILAAQVATTVPMN